MAGVVDSAGPFLRWAGGKRWLSPLLAAIAPPTPKSYVEPFLGAGSAFFALQPQSAVLADANSDLIETYETLRDYPEAVIRSLRRRRCDPDYFAVVRARMPADPITRASRFIFLNRTAFNGLYRVNGRGEFNVPYGCKPGTVLCDAAGLRAASRALTKTRLRAASFAEVLNYVNTTSLVYLDPPYTVAHNNNGFVRYNERLFRWQDQLDLAAWARVHAAGGGPVIVSNAAHDDVVRHYPKRLFLRFALSRSSRMAADPVHRRAFTELLLVSRALTTRRIVAQSAARLGLDVSDLDG